MRRFDDLPDGVQENAVIGGCAILWVFLIIGFVVMTFAGCALQAKPECERAEAVILHAEGHGWFYGFTPAALVQWTDAIRSEARGECEYKKDGAPA